MPRTGWVKPGSDSRLSDHISWGLLAKVYPPDVVDRVIADCGRLEKRKRVLPSRLVTYYVMGLALFSQSTYEETMRSLIAGQDWAAGRTRPWTVPTKAALFKARSRLGSEPLKALFDLVARPMATPATTAGFYGSLRLMSLDSARLDVPDTAANVEAFGRTGQSVAVGRKLPQVRVVGLTETGTRAIIHAAVGGIKESHEQLAAELLSGHLGGTLILAGRGYFSHRLWTTAVKNGAELLWRLEPDEGVAVERRHDDGSYDSWLDTDGVDGQEGGRIPIRVVVQPTPDDGDDTYRFATSILDPLVAPAEALLEIYLRRSWIASAFDELTATEQNPRMVLRSKVPDGVLQEVYGYLCVHYAVRWLMHGVYEMQDPLK